MQVFNIKRMMLRQLVKCCVAGQIGVAKVILSTPRGLEVLETSSSPAGFTPLMVASLHGHVKLIKLFLQNGASVYNKSYNGDTALHLAAGRGRWEAVMLLLHSGSDVDCQNLSGSTPLMHAASGHHEMIVDTLLHSRANPNIVDNMGQTAFMHTLIQMNTDPAEWEQASFKRPVASTEGSSILKKLLLAGADPDIVPESNPGGPMYLAAMVNCPDIIKKLVDLGCDVNGHTDRVFNPLLCSVECRSVQSFFMLIECGAHPFVYDTEMLCTAAQVDSVEITNYLLGIGVSPNTYNSDRRTALVCAVECGSVATAKRLIEAGANINAENGDGKTALTEAVHNQDVVLLQVLLEKGGNSSQEIWVHDHHFTDLPQYTLSQRYIPSKTTETHSYFNTSILACLVIQDILHMPRDLKEATISCLIQLNISKKFSRDWYDNEVCIQGRVIG